jgi:hypothetical protein
VAVHPLQTTVHLSDTTITIIPLAQAFRRYDFFLTVRRLFLYGIAGMICGWCASACNDAPGPIGAQLLPADSLRLFVVTTDSVPLLDSTSIGLITPQMASSLAFTSSSNPFFIGTAQAVDASGLITATTYMKFSLPVTNDSIRKADYSSLTANDIKAVYLQLFPNAFLLGDTVGRIAPFRIHTLASQWYNDSLTQTRNLPDVQNSLLGMQLAAYYEPLSTRGDGLINATNILNNKRLIELGTSLGNRQMFVNWIQSDSVAWTKVHGLAFVPIPSSGAKAMYGFAQSPNLVIKIQRQTDTEESFLTIQEYAQSCIISAPFPVNPNRASIAVQGGAAYRTRLSFNLRAAVPPLSTIHRAEFTVVVDTLRSLLSTFGLPASIQLHVPDSSNSFQPSGRIVATGTLDTARRDRYNFSSASNMTPLVEYIVKTGGAAKLLLYLRPQIATQSGLFRSDEEQTANRLIFYGLDAADRTKRPRLSITYSLRPR